MDHVGIDLHKNESQVCILTEQGELIETRIRTRRDRFESVLKELRPAVARSIEEAGSELLTFYEFPKTMWRALRTTNPLENLNREFRRRTRTMDSSPSARSACTRSTGTRSSRRSLPGARLRPRKGVECNSRSTGGYAVPKSTKIGTHPDPERCYEVAPSIERARNRNEPRKGGILRLVA